MTKDPVCLPSNISREEALAKLYEIRKEKIPLVDDDGVLTGLITKKDLKPNYPYSATDSKGRLVCALGCSPFLPKDQNKVRLLKEISSYVDIMFTDVAAFYKEMDMQGAKQLMELLDSKFVVGNIGTYEAAEHLLTKADFPEDKFIGIKGQEWEVAVFAPQSFKLVWVHPLSLLPQRLPMQLKIIILKSH